MIKGHASGSVAVVFLSMLVVGVLYLGVVDIDVIGPGESRAAEIAREMHERGEYLLPSLRGEVTAESLTKPPLFHWLLIASASPFDWANFSIRIPSILSMMACLWLVFRLASRMFDDLTGALSVLVLACSGLFIDFGVTARIDLFFSMLILIAMLGLEAAIRSQERAGPLAIFFIATGLAVATKGLAGFLIPVGTALVYAFFARRDIRLAALFPWWGIVLMLGIALPWYLYVILAAPPDLVNNMFFGEFRNWLEGEPTAGGQSAPWYYLPFLLGGMFPWSLFLPVAVWHAAVHVHKEHGRMLLLILIWFLGGLLLFSLGGKKAGRYLLPIVPPAAILLGWYWRQLMSGFSRYRTGAIISATLAMLAVLLITGALLFALADSDSALETANRVLSKSDKVAFALLWEIIGSHLTAARAYIASLAGLAILALIALWRSQVRLAAVSYSLIVLLLASVYFHVIEPDRAKNNSLRAIAMEVRQLVGDDGRLAVGGNDYQHALHWYLQRHFDRYGQDALKNMALTESGTSVLIMHRKPLPKELMQTRQYHEWSTPQLIVTLFTAEDPLQEQASPATQVH